MAENIKNTLTIPANISGWMVQFDFPKFPLEKNKLFETYTDALNYAKSTDSYIGNVISILNDQVIGEGTDAITYPAGVYVVTGIGATNGAITQVGKDTDLTGVESRLDSLELYATDQVSTLQELTSLEHNAGKILYLTQTVNNGLEGDEKVEYLAGAYISLGNGQLQKLSTSDAGGKTPEQLLSALEIRVSNAETNITNIQNDLYVEGETEGSKVLNIYTKSETDNKITAAISNVYKFKGSSENFPTEGLNNGDVWNITEGIEYNGKSYPAGTNFAYVVPENGEPHWDALAGIADLSGYALKTDIKDWVLTTTFNSHVNNEGTALHVTASEKEIWSSKQNAITDENKLSATLVSGLATVSTSGSYNDLTNLPVIPSTDGLATQESVNTLSGTVGTLSTEVSTIKTTLSTEGANEGDVLTYNGSSVIWSSVPAGTTITTTEEGKSTIAVGGTSTIVYTSEKVDNLLSGKQGSLLNGTETEGQVATIVKENGGSKIVWSNPQVTTLENDTTNGTSVITYTNSNKETITTTVYTSVQTDKQIENALKWNKLVEETETEEPQA